MSKIVVHNVIWNLKATADFLMSKCPEVDKIVVHAENCTDSCRNDILDNANDFLLVDQRVDFHLIYLIVIQESLKRSIVS